MSYDGPAGNIVEEVRLICVNPTGNNNKFILCRLFDDSRFWRCWGRVRADEQGELVKHASSQKLEHSGKSGMEKFIYSKTKDRGPGKTYTRVDAVDGMASSASSRSVSTSSLKEVARKQIDAGCPITQKLVEYLADVNAHQIMAATALTLNKVTGMFQTPLGIVTPGSVQDARSKLDILADAVAKRDWQSFRFNEALERYLRLIPHDLGHRFSGESFLPDLQRVREENDILDALDASYRTATTAPTQKVGGKKQTDAPKIFDVKLEVVQDSQVRDKLTRDFLNTRNRMHAVYNYKIKEIFKVDIKEVREAFEKRERFFVGSSKSGKVLTLYHGTRAHNLLSIMKAGLMIPPSSSSYVTGRLAGNGVYGAPASTKALQYAAGYAPGQSRFSVSRFFMFVCRFSMGKIWYPSSLNGSFPKPGYDSTYLKGGKCGFLRNDECIVYDTSQVTLDYLLEFSPK